MSKKGWRGEKQRHSMAARGIETKSELEAARKELLRQQEELNKRLSSMDLKLEKLDLPEQIEREIQWKIQDTIEEKMEDAPLTDEEWEFGIRSMSIREFTKTFYDDSWNDMIDDNPLVIYFLLEHFDSATVRDYYKDAFNDWRMENPRDKDKSDDSILETLSESEAKEFFVQLVYDGDIRHLFDDNPGIFEELQNNWIKGQPYEEDMRKWMVEEKRRNPDDFPLTPKELDRIRGFVLDMHEITEAELAKIKKERGY